MKEKKIKRNPQIPPMNGGKGVDVSKTLFYVSKGGFMGEIILAIIKAVITVAEKDKKN